MRPQVLRVNGRPLGLATNNKPTNPQPNNRSHWGHYQVITNVAECRGLLIVVRPLGLVPILRSLDLGLNSLLCYETFN